MATSVREPRPAASQGRRESSGPRRRRASASLREVCLIGLARGVPAEPLPAAWKPGDRLRWSGRDYAVEATQTPGETPGYAYLAPALTGSA